MAVTPRSSQEITAEDAKPLVLNPSFSEGLLRSKIGYVANAADDDATSVFRFVRVPSNACIRGVLLSTGDASSAGAINVGVYQTAANGGAVVDADLFASAFVLTNGSFSRVDLTFESGEYTALEATKPLWEVLGLTVDPQIEYDIVAVVSTTLNGGAVGMLLEVQYVQ